MVSVQHPIDEKLKATHIQLFPGDKPLEDDDFSR